MVPTDLNEVLPYTITVLVTSLLSTLTRIVSAIPICLRFVALFRFTALSRLRLAVANHQTVNFTSLLLSSPNASDVVVIPWQ